MVRKILDCPEIPQLNNNDEKFDLKIEFISPYFGGGTDANATNNDKKLIRESSIRGQLRFWWRATIGAKYTLEKMKKREADIFGSTTSKPNQSSRVIIKVTEIENISMFESYYKYKNNKGFLTDKTDYPYVLFPFKEIKDSRKKIDGKNIGLSFKLNITIKNKHCKENELSVKDIRTDLDNTLKAWLNFGGLGARTRRGLGSLYCEDKKYCFNNIKELKEFLPTIQNKDFPSINKIIVMNKKNFYNKESKENYWYIPLDKTLKEFRQGDNIGREFKTVEKFGRTKREPKRSFWPEPEIIRQITNRRSPGHDYKEFEQCFPRAEFGLPIIIKFKDEKIGDPILTEIQPKDNGEQSITRFASPIIIRNIKLSDGTFYPIVLLLNGPRPEKIKLKQNNKIIKNNCPVKWINKGNKKLVNSNGSAIEKFIEFINDNFVEKESNIFGGSK